MATYERRLVEHLAQALVRPPALLHIVVGPRQVGKTTAAHAVAARWDGPVRYAAADELLPPGAEWVRTQWQLARRQSRDQPCLLVLDEIQKVPGWSEMIKSLWDADHRGGHPVRALLLGSSALLLARGSTESLAGRFFLHRCLHWSYAECREAFGWDLDRWLFYGGYPGAVPLVADLEAWRRYVRDSLIEAVLGRDVLALERVTKPALLRQLFAFVCRFPAQPVAYNKMLGQLQDAGNTTTLAHYLQLLEHAFLVSGLERFSSGRARSRGSTPKLVAWNNALVNALDVRDLEEARHDGAWWGRLTENAVGAHLANNLQGVGHEVAWWRDGRAEVDYVVRSGKTVWALEVKSGRERSAPGLEAFRKRHPNSRTLLVGPGGLGVEEFLLADPAELLRSL